MGIEENPGYLPPSTLLRLVEWGLKESYTLVTLRHNWAQPPPPPPHSYSAIWERNDTLLISLSLSYSFFSLCDRYICSLILAGGRGEGEGQWSQLRRQQMAIAFSNIFPVHFTKQTSWFINTDLWMKTGGSVTGFSSISNGDRIWSIIRQYDPPAKDNRFILCSNLKDIFVNLLAFVLTTFVLLALEVWVETIYA